MLWHTSQNRSDDYSSSQFQILQIRARAMEPGLMFLPRSSSNYVTGLEWNGNVLRRLNVWFVDWTPAYCQHLIPYHSSQLSHHQLASLVDYSELRMTRATGLPLFIYRPLLMGLLCVGSSDEVSVEHCSVGRLMGLGSWKYSTSVLSYSGSHSVGVGVWAGILIPRCYTPLLYGAVV